MNYKDYLIENVLSFWLENGIDYENGGIFTCLDRMGCVYGFDKSVWFQGRALWVFSKMYNLFEKNPDYLKASHNIARFLVKCYDHDDRMFFLVTRDGNPIQKRRYYFSETFAAIGFCEYYKATGDEAAWEMAKKSFFKAYELFKNPKLTVPKYNPNAYTLKALSPVMILLSTAGIMRSAGRNPELYQSIVDEMLNEIVNGGFLNREYNALLENVSLDGCFSDTPKGRLVNPGHSLEAAWFIMSEGILKDDLKLIEISKSIIKSSMKLGFDEKLGGLYSFVDILNKPVEQLEWDMRLWWPHNEAMIALYLAHDQCREKAYADDFERVSSYAFKHFEDKTYSEWYGYLHYDGTPAQTLKGNIFKGPFHLPRMLMILSELQNGNGIKRFMG